MNKALLVGINNYPSPYPVLRGCINDINDMANYLVAHQNFPMNNIRLLADDRATKANIILRLKWLVWGAKKGDRLLFHYSGHGSQFATRNPEGEVDGLDEIICPYDFDWNDEHMIKDKEFAQLFKTVPAGVEFVWVSDSCHSADLSRDMRRPSGGVTIINRSITPPADIEWRIQTALNSNIKLRQLSKAITPLNVALISGCESTQESADASFNGRANGALTYFLLQELNTANGNTEPLTTVVQNINTALDAARYSQNPQLEGSSVIMNKAFLKV